MEYLHVSRRRREPARSLLLSRGDCASCCWPASCRHPSRLLQAAIVFLLMLTMTLASPLPARAVAERVVAYHKSRDKNDVIQSTSKSDVITRSLRSSRVSDISRLSRPFIVNDVTQRLPVGDVRQLSSTPPSNFMMLAPEHRLRAFKGRRQQIVDVANDHADDVDVFHTFPVRRTRRSVGPDTSLYTDHADDVFDGLNDDASDILWPPTFKSSDSVGDADTADDGGLLFADDDDGVDYSFEDVMQADEPTSRRKQPRHATQNYFLHSRHDYVLTLWPNGTVGGVRPSSTHHLNHSLVKIVTLGHQQLNLQRISNQPVGYVGIQDVKSGQYLCVNSKGHFYSKAFTGDPSVDCRFYEEHNEEHYKLFYSATHGNNVTSDRCITPSHTSVVNASASSRPSSHKRRHHDGLPGVCRKWYVAFNDKGKVMKGPRSQPSANAQFISKPESEEFHSRGITAPGMKNVHNPFLVEGSIGSHHSRHGNRRQDGGIAADSRASDSPFSGLHGGGRRKVSKLGQGHGRESDGPFHGGDAVPASGEQQQQQRSKSNSKKSQQHRNGNGLDNKKNGENLESMFSAHHDGSAVRDTGKTIKNKRKKKVNGRRRYDLPLLV